MGKAIHVRKIRIKRAAVMILQTTIHFMSVATRTSRVNTQTPLTLFGTTDTLSKCS
jgi:hypothetical protein